tara:strand:+ start:2307 stop:3056 length:750 start_codon:yes stop_codon:yes gene_type:complete
MSNAWITGAGKGIGRAVALELAAQGWTVAASARTDSELRELEVESQALSGEIHAYPLDVTSESDVASTVAMIKNEHGALELVVLNAGTHTPVTADSFETDVFRRLMDVNFFGTINCLAAVLPGFRDHRTGHIAVVASVAGYRGLPTSAAYGATKAALINVCEALYPEFAREGVRISLINPGFVRTPLTDRNPFPMPFLMEPNDAARRLVKGLASGRFETTFPRRLTWLLKMLRVLPYAAYFRIMKRITL